MGIVFSDRVNDVPRSFIREILKVALDDTIISFAGGLPNRDLFPVEALKRATLQVFDVFGSNPLQYGESEGFLGLREWISMRYWEKKGLEIPAKNILIINGSQQGLDLLGKILINDGDSVIIEEPGYLGAIQAFSFFKPKFCPVTIAENGMNIELFNSIMSSSKPKLIYSVPNFQNPSGISYSQENLCEMAGIIRNSNTLIIEDDPYGDLRYWGEPKPSFKSLLPDHTVLLGSFSKILVPGLRLGWIAAPDAIIEKLLIAKQAADLHTSHFTQCVVYEYLKDNDIDAHISTIKKVYGNQMRTMLNSIDAYFPPDVSHTNPEGGMFLWVTLPGQTSSRELLDLAIRDKVIFVPGDPFYVNTKTTNTLRLNFSCSDASTIHEGIKRLAKAMRQLLDR